MIHYNDSDYLMHYGVPGMKWGHRKAYTSSYTTAYREASATQHRKASKYRAKAKRGSLHNVIGLAKENSGLKKSAQKSYAKGDKKEAKWLDKAAKAESKSKELGKYAKKSAELDKKIDDRRKSQNTGKKIVSSLLNVSSGTTRGYDTMRAVGVSRGKAVFDSLIGDPIGAGLRARDKYVKGK